MRSETSALGVKNNKIIIAEKEKIFLEFCKNLDIKDIKTNDDIIIGTRPHLASPQGEEQEEEDLVIIYGKDILKTIEYIKNNYILIEKIIVANTAEVLSNSEIKDGDIIIPNTFISKAGETKFLDSTIGKDYDMKKFGLMLSGICSEDSGKKSEFQADIKSENVFKFLKALESEELLEKTIVVSQIGEKNYDNLIAIVDMTI